MKYNENKNTYLQKTTTPSCLSPQAEEPRIAKANVNAMPYHIIYDTYVP